MSAWICCATAWTRSVPLGSSLEVRTCLCGLVDPAKHRSTGDGTKDLTGQPRGGKTGGDDAENGGGVLFALPGIKYDGNWLCRGDSPSFRRVTFLQAWPYTHRRC